MFLQPLLIGVAMNDSIRIALAVFATGTLLSAFSIPPAYAWTDADAAAECATYNNGPYVFKPLGRGSKNHVDCGADYTDTSVGALERMRQRIERIRKEEEEYIKKGGKPDGSSGIKK